MSARDTSWGALACAAALAVPLTIYRGWTIKLLWGWFVVPIGAPPIGMAVGLGLGALTYLLTSDGAHSDENADWRWCVRMLSRSLSVTSGALIGGFVYSWFLP